jgi:aspartyl-tRNA(Asn)/glutamyl-tRNA(Gln) amidotransferase subunit B
MRTKEEAQDYRYFPEPDLPPFVISKEKVEEIRKTIPELPREKMKRIMDLYLISASTANILVSSKNDSAYAEECIKAYPNKDKKIITNWFIGPLLSEANARNCSLIGLGILAKDLVELIGYVDREELSNLAAKSVLTEMIDTKKSPSQIIKEKNLIQISDSSALEEIVQQVINENSKSVDAYKTGKTNAIMALVGQVMKKSGGKANPKVVQELLKRRLTNA